MLKILNVSKSYGPRTLFEGLSLSVDTGQKFALVGPNGSGKSTLLKIIAGEIPMDEGEVKFTNDECVGYLPQEVVIDANTSIAEYVSDYVNRRRGIECFPQVKHRMLAMMDVCRLGFSANRPIVSLSGGEKTKIALIAALLADPDILLLDEPTNNIDLSTMLWLETYLRRSGVGMIVVSHDRKFLERITNRVVEIEPHMASVVIRRGTFADYLHDREKERQRLLQEYEEQQAEIKRLKEQASRLRGASERGSHWTGSDKDKFLRGFKRDRASKSGKKAKTLDKRIGQMGRIERPATDDELKFKLQPGIINGSADVTIEHAAATYPSGFSCGPISLAIPYGTQAVIVGANGAGKSTLLRMISGELELSTGNVYKGSEVKLGDFTQGHDALDPDKTPVQLIMDKAAVRSQDAYATLALYGIKTEKPQQFIGSLSPGERARVLLALFSALSANVLLLDEPTNHLDLEAQEALEVALKNFMGTLLMVSHDRFFIERVGIADAYLMENGKLKGTEALSAYVSRAERTSQKMSRLLI